MKINEYMDLRRLGLLFLKDIKEGWRGYLVNFSSILSFFFICFLITGKTGNLTISTYAKLFFPALFICGAIFTSNVFSSAHTKYHNHEWLMLPASTLEKFTEKLILSSILFAIAFLGIFSLFTIISSFVLLAVFKVKAPIFNPFELYVWKSVLNYLIIHSVFFLGAALFRTRNFIKTILSVSGLTIAMIFLFFFIISIIFNNYYDSITAGEINISIHGGKQIFVDRMRFFGKGFITFVKILYYGIMAPLCWVLSYLKLLNIEVKDGV